MTMKTLHTLVVVTALTSAVAGAASAQTKTKKPPKIESLSGCIEQDENIPNQFTLSDPKAGGRFRITGKDFREYLGRRVELDGGVAVKGLKISGGLQPNANIAAQAGALDPSRAAVQAATSGSTTGKDTDVLQEFRVKTIRATGGACK